MSIESTAPPTSVERRVMIITGANSGIGEALAKLAAQHGWRVLAVARRADKLQAVVDAIGAADGDAVGLALDVTAADAPQRIVKGALSAFGRIDIVVNNAGHGAPGSLLEQSDAAIEAQWQLHVAAPLRITRAAHAEVRARKGGFAFVGSGLARVPAPGFGAYCAAKAAVRAAAIQLRRELVPDGIAVTYIDPGVVDTGFSEASGMERGANSMRVKPAVVAAAILRGLERRAARVNAVPWQTAGVVLGEWFPALADRAMHNIVSKPRLQAPVVEAPAAAAAAALVSQLPETPDRDEFDLALEPVARRMERVKLPASFVRDVIDMGGSIELGEIAMKWAGMPNKNERAVMREVLDALSNAGYLTSTGEESWNIVRSTEPADRD